MKPRSNPFVRTALAAFSLAFGAISAHAASVTWAGASGADWNTGTNWSTSAKPANADIAVFNLTGITSVTNATANQTVTNSFNCLHPKSNPHFPALWSDPIALSGATRANSRNSTVPLSPRSSCSATRHPLGHRCGSPCPR